MQELSQRDCVLLLVKVADEIRSVILPYVDSNTLAAIDRSLDQARHAAAGKLPNRMFAKAAHEATLLTGSLELFAREMFLDESDRESPIAKLSHVQITAIREVADVAARALRAAVDKEVASANEECWEGVSWAQDLANRTEDFELLARIDRLCDQAFEEQPRQALIHEIPWWKRVLEWLRRN